MDSFTCHFPVGIMDIPQYVVCFCGDDRVGPDTLVQFFVVPSFFGKSEIIPLSDSLCR